MSRPAEWWTRPTARTRTVPTTTSARRRSSPSSAAASGLCSRARSRAWCTRSTRIAAARCFGSSVSGKAARWVVCSGVPLRMAATSTLPCPTFTGSRSRTHGPRTRTRIRAGGCCAAVTRRRRVWHTPPAECGERPRCSPAQPGAVSGIPGAVLSGSMDGHLRAYSTADGSVLWDFDTARSYETVNGVPGRGGSLDGAGPAIAGGLVIVNSGYPHGGGMPGNVVLALSVDGK